MEVFTCAILFLAVAAARGGGADDPTHIARLPVAEREATYLALESINSGIEWRSIYQDDLCLFGPHGVVCDLFPDGSGGSVPHITELNFGYLSDFNSNPECGPKATVPPLLSSLAFPFLRRLLFYNCFRFDRTQLPTGFWNMSISLEELILHDNPSLVGRLSSRIACLTRLRRFVVSGTRISGGIPAEIGQLQNLEQLVLSRNRLRRSIPASAGSLARLKILDLSGNGLVGRLSSEIGCLHELVKLDLSSNRLAGPVPWGFAMLSRLEFVDLSHNRLTGGVPTALAEMRSLVEIYLSGNPLGGHIPEIWENLGGVLRLGLSSVGLIGNIPRSLGLHLKNISYLSLDNNSLVGELPDQLKLLEQSAMEINLENNAFHGRIPFSASFVAAIGGKLKLSGNPKLCMYEDAAAYLRGNGSMKYQQYCNKTEIPHPALFSSLSDLMRPHAFGLAVFFVVLLL